MKNRTRIIAILVLVFAVGLLGWLFFAGAGSSGGNQVVSEEIPSVVVLDFYDPWVSALKDPDTDPYQKGLAEAPILSEELRAKLAAAQERPEGEPDPVLCQTGVPGGISARPIFEDDESAQVLVMATRQELPGQAVVTLTKLNNGWYIDDIECSSGETAPEREFSFEREGYLLKDVPAPLDPQYWHIVFEQNNQQGHTAPLFFGAESMCEDESGVESVCNPDQFTEASKVMVKGEMSETGVEVKRLELIE
ncbi:MAG: hypothetical protein WDZ82_01420 [Candidatus Paceibacterota bacterium]